MEGITDGEGCRGKATGHSWPQARAPISAAALGAPHPPEGILPQGVGHTFPLRSPNQAGPEPSQLLPLRCDVSRSEARCAPGGCLRGGSEGDGRTGMEALPRLEGGEWSGARPGCTFCLGGPELCSSEKHLQVWGPEVPRCRGPVGDSERAAFPAQSPRPGRLSLCEADIGFPSLPPPHCCGSERPLNPRARPPGRPQEADMVQLARGKAPTQP